MKTDLMLAVVGALAIGYTSGRVQPWRRFRDEAWSRTVFRPLETKRQMYLAFAMFSTAYPVRAFQALRDRDKHTPARPTSDKTITMRDQG